MIIIDCDIRCKRNCNNKIYLREASNQQVIKHLFLNWKCKELFQKLLEPLNHFNSNNNNNNSNSDDNNHNNNNRNNLFDWFKKPKNIQAHFFDKIGSSLVSEKKVPKHALYQIIIFNHWTNVINHVRHDN